MTTTFLPIAQPTYDQYNEQSTRNDIETRLQSIEDKLRTLLTTYGTLALGEQGLTLANGSNNNVSSGVATYCRVTGPTGAFTITGLANGERGRLVLIRNTTTQDMTIANESASSDAANRIVTQTGSDVTTSGQGLVTLVYDSTSSRWVVCSVQS